MPKHICRYCLEELNSDESYTLHLLEHSITQTNQILADIYDVLNQINSSISGIAYALEQITKIQRIRRVE